MDTPGERLKWAREHKTSHKTATDAARAYGWTISTYLGHENGDRTPSRKAAKIYAAAYKVPWEWILEGGVLTGRRGRTGPIPTIGEMAAGQWLDLDVELAVGDYEQFPIAADPRFASEAQYGLIVRGSSINRLATAGDVLHCLDTSKAQIEPSEDDLVIVERKRAAAGQREVSAKRLRRRGRTIILAPDSTEPRWKPIEIDAGHQTGEETVEVIALVLAIYKPLKQHRK